MSTRCVHQFAIFFGLVLSPKMNKVVFVFPCFFLSAIAVEPFHRHVIVSPHSASEVFYSGSKRQILAPAAPLTAAVPASTVPLNAVPAPLTAAVESPAVSVPVPAAVPAQVAVPAPIAVPAPLAAVASQPLPVQAPITPVVNVQPSVAVVPEVTKIAQFKLSYPQYAYGYSVQDFTTGDNKMAKEIREGGIVKGSYSLADPDGTKRTVNYYADPIHGFNAVVHKTQILK